MPESTAARLAQAKQLAKDVHAAARQRGSRAIPVRLQQVAGATTGAARIVVVGERKRGKSTLINALLDAPDLLPRDVDVATNTYIEVVSPLRVGRSPEPRGVVHLQNGSSYDIDLADLGRWASEQGNPGNARQVAYVQVLLPHPLLDEGLMIVDTPGLGGLASAHGTMTLTALDQCDALVLMLSAAAPAGAHELDFLVQASRRTERVLILESAGPEAIDPRAIVAADRAAMSTRAPSLSALPITVVAPLEAHDALTERDPRTRAELRELSNVERFADDLRRLVIAPVLDAQADILIQETASCLAELGAPDRALLSAVGGDPAAAATRAKAELTDAERRSPIPTFDARFLELRRDVDAQMQGDVGRRRDELLDEIEDHWSSTLAQALPERCRAILAEAAVAATESLAARGSALAADAAERSGLVRSGAEASAAGAPELDLELPDRLQTSRRMDQERVLGWVSRGGPMLMIGVVTGNPVLVGIGVVMVAASEQVQGATVSRRRAREHVQRLISRGQGTLRAALDERAGSLREAYVVELSAIHEARLERLNATVRAVQGAGDAEGARRRVEEIETLEARLAALEPAPAVAS